MIINNIFDEMLKKITSLPFVKENVIAIYSVPKALKATDKWVDLYYKLGTNVSPKECRNFENQVSLMFADEQVCCAISHIDYAPDTVKNGGAVWES